MVGPGQDVAVEDAGTVAGDRLRQQAPGGFDQVAAADRRVADDRGSDGRAQAIELAVEGRERGDQLELAPQERRAGGGVEPTDNIEHDQHEMLEGKLAGVFALGGLLEEKVEGGALEEPIQGDPGHHGDRALLDAGIEDGREVRDERRGRVEEIQPGGRVRGGATGGETCPRRFVGPSRSISLGDIGSPP